MCEPDTTRKKVCKATTSGKFHDLSFQTVTYKGPFHGGRGGFASWEASDVAYSILHPYIPLVLPALNCFSSQPQFMLRLGRRFHMHPAAQPLISNGSPTLQPPKEPLFLIVQSLISLS